MECKFAPANLLGEQMRPASRCFDYIQLELESSNLACLRLTKSTQRLRRFIAFGLEFPSQGILWRIIPLFESGVLEHPKTTQSEGSQNVM